MYGGLGKPASDGAPSTPARYPTFADGHDIMAVCDAVAEPARTESWAKVDRA